MIIELVESDESRVRWNNGDGWHFADLDDLIKAYEHAYEHVKHGAWLPNITDLGTMIFRCSECQRFSDVHWAYCPRCGAKMDGETDGQID